MKSKFIIAMLATASIAMMLRFASNVTAEPAMQNPTPTDEPTKRPYVFPTPIFLPTFASSTDLPQRPNVAATVALAGAQSYTVQAGDNPSIIARKVYGDPTKFQLIVDANRLTESNRLRVGMVLTIPPINPTSAPALPPTPPTPSLATTITSPPPSPTFAEIAIATAEPQVAIDDSPNSVKDALVAMGIVVLIGFIGVTLLALHVYRNSKREERINFIKKRIK